MMKVAVIMGSASDADVLAPCAETLRALSIPFEVRVLSAHRTPEAAARFAEKARENGFGVLIAAAGKAAHLAGTLAAHTTLPVIGIPVPTDLAGGLDSLLSMVQMPGDVPVATVGAGMGGPRNAGILAVQMLALADPTLRQKLVEFKKELVQKITQKNEAFQKTL